MSPDKQLGECSNPLFTVGFLSRFIQVLALVLMFTTLPLSKASLSLRGISKTLRCGSVSRG